MTGNFQDANSYIKIAINIARSEKVSKAYMDGLLRLQGGIEQASKK
jgi:hypothetical protein